MKVVVTGAAGYLGSAVTKRLLSEGHSIVGIDSLLYGDHALAALTDLHLPFIFHSLPVDELTEKEISGADAVVHLAALVGDPVCRENPELAVKTNWESTKALFAVSRKAKIKRFVFASTCSNYGLMGNPDAPLDEDAPLNPLSLYAETKVGSERYLLSEEAPDTSVTLLRFATLFGVSDRMRFDLTVNHFSRDLFSKGEVSIFAGNSWRPYLHVRDAARAIAKIVTCPLSRVRRQVFNVGSDSLNFTKEEIAAIIRRQLPFESRVKIAPNAEPDLRNYRVSFKKIEETLSFVAEETIDTGVREIVEGLEKGAFPDPFGERYTNSPLRLKSLR